MRRDLPPNLTDDCWTMVEFARPWQVRLVVSLIDPVTGLLIREGVRVAVMDAAGRAAHGSPILTASGRIAFRTLPQGQGCTLLIQPGTAPFLPAIVAVPPEAAVGGVPAIEIVLTPSRGYPFAPRDRVLHHRILHAGQPLVGAAVALVEPTPLLAAPARTDADGEFVLFLRANGRGRAAPPITTEPMPPGLAPAPAQAVAPAEERAGLAVTWRGERRTLAATAAPILRPFGKTGQASVEDAIRWEDLALGDGGEVPDLGAAPPTSPTPSGRSRRGRAATP